MTFLITAEVAARLRETPQTVVRRLRRGELVGSKTGRQWLVDESEVEKFLAARRNFVPTDQRRRRR